jgi:hypothetical protein
MSRFRPVVFSACNKTHLGGHNSRNDSEMARGESNASPYPALLTR